MIFFFSKTPCGCFLVALWYPKTTAKNAGRYAKKNPITILQVQFKDRCSQTYFQFFGITFSFSVSLVRSLLIFEICCRRHIEVLTQPSSQGLSSLPPLVVGKKDPGCGWSHDHPESGWQKNLLGGRGGRILCLVDVTNSVGFKSSSSR